MGCPNLARFGELNRLYCWWWLAGCWPDRIGVAAWHRRRFQGSCTVTPRPEHRVTGSVHVLTSDSTSVVIDDSRPRAQDRAPTQRRHPTHQRHSHRPRMTTPRGVTDPALVAVVWGVLSRAGSSGGRVLEPGCLFIGDPPAPAPHERLKSLPGTRHRRRRCGVGPESRRAGVDPHRRRRTWAATVHDRCRGNPAVASDRLIRRRRNCAPRSPGQPRAVSPFGSR